MSLFPLFSQGGLAPSTLLSNLSLTVSQRGAVREGVLSGTRTGSGVHTYWVPGEAYMVVYSPTRYPGGIQGGIYPSPSPPRVGILGYKPLLLASQGGYIRVSRFITMVGIPAFTSGKTEKPATERGCAQERRELATPVSLLEKKEGGPLPTPVSLLG